MKSSALKLIVKISLVTAAVIILFQVVSVLYVYKYFKFDYYLAAVALCFLGVGLVIARYKPVKAKNPQRADPTAQLTARELHILQLIIDGKSNKEIAAINFVEISTVKTHINNIYTKLGLSNRKEAINAYKNKLNQPVTANIHPFST